MDRRKSVLLLSIILVGLCISLFPIRLDYHYWDETVYLQHAEILTGESPNNYNEFDFRPPMMSLIMSAVYLFGPSTVNAHIAVAVLSTLGIPLTYLLGRELYGQKEGLLASFIYALSPIAIIESHDILVDPILPLFWLSTGFFLYRAVTTQKDRYFVLTGLSVALSVLTKFTSLVLIPAVAAIIMFEVFKDRDITRQEAVSSLKTVFLGRKSWLAVSGFVAGMTPYLVWGYLTYGHPLHMFFTAWTFSGAPAPFLTYLSQFSMFLLPPFILGLLLYSGELKDFRDPSVYVLIIIVLSLYLPLQFFLENRQLRFMLPIVPFLAIMSARGFSRLEGRNWFKPFLAAVLILSVMMLPSHIEERSVFEDGTYVDRWYPPVMDASDWLKNNAEPDTVVYTNYQYPPLGYYSKEEVVVVEPGQGPWTELIGTELRQPGYVYYSEVSPHEHPGLENLQESSYFRLEESFDDQVYIFYFEGVRE